VVVIAADDILGARPGPPLAPANCMRSALWILAALAPLLFGGCDRDRDHDRETSAATPTSVTDAPPPTTSKAPELPSGPPSTVDLARPRAPALAVGDRLAPVTSRAGDGTVGCGPCRLGQVPRLIVIGSTAALALARAETWRNLDAMSRLYADNGLSSLAIVVAGVDGTATPPADPAGTATQIALVRAHGRIAMPVDIATDTGALGGVVDDPCVVLVDGADTVRFVGGAGPHWRELDLAIAALLAAP